MLIFLLRPRVLEPRAPDPRLSEDGFTMGVLVVSGCDFTCKHRHSNNRGAESDARSSRQYNIKIIIIINRSIKKTSGWLNGLGRGTPAASTLYTVAGHTQQCVGALHTSSSSAGKLSLQDVFATNHQNTTRTITTESYRREQNKVSVCKGSSSRGILPSKKFLWHA